MTATLIIIIGVIALLVIVGIFMYNRLVQLRNRVEAGWSQIDVQLKRRYDLIPNLVETVKGYAAHERETLEAVVAARQQAVSANGVEEQAQAENMLTGALRQLFAVAEAYPDLKANQNFLALQEELTGTEGRIAYRAPVLQRPGVAVRQRARAIPKQHLCRSIQLRRGGVLRGRRGRQSGIGEGRLRPGGRDPAASSPNPGTTRATAPASVVSGTIGHVPAHSVQRSQDVATDLHLCPDHCGHGLRVRVHDGHGSDRARHRRGRGGRDELGELFQLRQDRPEGQPRG